MATEIKIDRGDGSIETIPIEGLEKWIAEIQKFNSVRSDSSNDGSYTAALSTLVRNEINRGFEELHKAIRAEAIQRNQAAAESSASAVFRSRAVLHPMTAYGRQFAVAAKEDPVRGLFVRAAQIGTIGIPPTLPSPMHSNYNGFDPRAIRAVVETYFLQEGIIGRKEVFDDVIAEAKTAVVDARMATEMAKGGGERAFEEAKAAVEATRALQGAFETSEKKHAALLQDSLSKYEATLEAGEAVRKKRIDEWEVEQREQAERRDEDAKTTMDGWIAERTREIEAAKSALKISFATETAHTYWAETKYKRHRNWAIGSGIVGFLYMAAIIGGIGYLAWRILSSDKAPKGFDKPLLETPISAVALLVVGTILVIWLGRLIARTYMAHMQLVEDAKERATMIETYIALIRADAMKPEGAEAQKAIFRTASSGLLAGDGSPDTPVEVLMKQLTPKKD